jgi:hypothetical protein
VGCPDLIVASRIDVLTRRLQFALEPGAKELHDLRFGPGLPVNEVVTLVGEHRSVERRPQLFSFERVVDEGRHPR